MKFGVTALCLVAGLLMQACAGSGGATAATGDGAQGATASAASKKNAKAPEVSVLKLDASEVPAQVRAIETLIDRPSALLADEVAIEVSKNYEWDVSLSGDGVLPQKPEAGGTFSEATGNPRAHLRNLDIRARNKITVWRSGLNVTPFIRVYAKGGVSYIDEDDAGKGRVKRGNNCRISNATIAFDEQILGMPEARPAGANAKN